MTTDIDRLDLETSDLDVEALDAFDILVGDLTQRQRGILPDDEADLVRFIVDRWLNDDVSSTEALKWLDNGDLLDPDALMLGYAAVVYARGVQSVPPTPIPPAAPGMRHEPSRELLEAIGRRVA